jgi:hypothetical protein
VLHRPGRAAVRSARRRAHPPPAVGAGLSSSERHTDDDLRAEFAQSADLQAEFICADDYVFAMRHRNDPGKVADLRRFAGR